MGVAGKKDAPLTEPNLLRSARTGLRPDLAVDLVTALRGHVTLTVLYRNDRLPLAAEAFKFRSGVKVICAVAC